MFKNTKHSVIEHNIAQINKNILSLAVPSILANITVPLVGIVDTAIVGHISDAVAIGGIAIGTMLFDLLYWNFAFLRSGTGGLTAQAYGRKDVEAQADLITQSITIAAVGAILIWMIQWFYVSLVLWLVPCSDGVADFARQYFYIRIWAAPATLSSMAIKGWLIGMQNTIGAMICDLTINVTNIVLSFVLSYYTRLGVMGVAWGTLAAQYIGLIAGLIIIVSKFTEVVRAIDIKRACKLDKMKSLFSLNGNLMLRSICMLVIYVGFTSIASKYGDAELAVSSIMMKMFLLFSYFIDGFAYAGEALTGKYIGSHEDDKLKQSIKYLFAWTIGIGFLFTVIYALAGTDTIALLTSDISVIEGSRPYIIWMILMPIVSCAAFMWDGIYIGATAGREIRNSTLWAANGFVVVYMLFFKQFGIQALYAAYFTHLLARFLYLQVAWHSVYNALGIKKNDGYSPS